MSNSPRNETDLERTRLALDRATRDLATDRQRLFELGNKRDPESLQLASVLKQVVQDRTWIVQVLKTEESRLAERVRTG